MVNLWPGHRHKRLPDSRPVHIWSYIGATVAQTDENPNADCDEKKKYQKTQCIATCSINRLKTCKQIRIALCATKKHNVQWVQTGPQGKGRQWPGMWLHVSFTSSGWLTECTLFTGGRHGSRRHYKGKLVKELGFVLWSVLLAFLWMKLWHAPIYHSTDEDHL